MISVSPTEGFGGDIGWSHQRRVALGGVARCVYRRLRQPQRSSPFNFSRGNLQIMGSSSAGTHTRLVATSHRPLHNLSLLLSRHYRRYTITIVVPSYDLCRRIIIIVVLSSSTVSKSQKYRLQYWATRSSVRLFARTVHLFACSALVGLVTHFAALAHSLARSLRCHLNLHALCR